VSVIVSSGKFAGVSYDVDASEITGEVLTVTYDNPTESDRIIRIAAGDLCWSYTMIRKSNGVVVVDPGNPGDGCTVSLS